VLLEPIYIPSDEESHLGGESLNITIDDCGPEDAIMMVISDDSVPTTSGVGSQLDQLEDSGAAGSDFERPMTVVIPNSDDDDIYTDAEIPMTIVVDSDPESEGVNDDPIPTTVYMSESEGSEDCDADDLPGVESGRDPHTGKFTPASFSHFQDVWLE